MRGYEFILSQEQIDKYIKWKSDKEDRGEDPYVGAAGGAYSFIFIPTGIGIIVRVTCTDGTELDLTEWNNW